MSRDIKFRLWNQETKTMIHPSDSTHYLLTFIGNVLGNYDYINKSGEREHTFFDIDNVELMQYVGLKDRNGKEIYEGDIVVKDSYIWLDDSEPNYRGTVDWIYSQWQVIAHCINKNRRGISDGVNEGLNDEGFEENEKSDWIVIGNIYDNPELLEGGE